MHFFWQRILYRPKSAQEINAKGHFKQRKQDAGDGKVYPDGFRQAVSYQKKAQQHEEYEAQGVIDGQHKRYFFQPLMPERKESGNVHQEESGKKKTEDCNIEHWRRGSEGKQAVKQAQRAKKEGGDKIETEESVFDGHEPSILL